MKLKTIEVNGTTYAAIENGNPVFIHADGKELAFDAAGTIVTISRLNAEAKSHREGKEQALEKLKAFDGIEDANAAREALKTVKNFDAKKFVDAGEVEKIKSEAIKAVEEKFAPVVRERDRLNQQLVSEILGGGFARSKFIADKVAVPAEMVQATFGHQFKVENGKVIGHDAAGNPLYSRSKPGDLAGIDEALEMIIDGVPFRDRILKSAGASGGGAQGAGNGAGAGAKVMSRTQFDTLDPVARVTYMSAGGTIHD